MNNFPNAESLLSEEAKEKIRSHALTAAENVYECELLFNSEIARLNLSGNEAAQARAAFQVWTNGIILEASRARGALDRCDDEAEGVLLEEIAQPAPPDAFLTPEENLRVGELTVRLMPHTKDFLELFGIIEAAQARRPDGLPMSPEMEVLFKVLSEAKGQIESGGFNSFGPSSGPEKFN